MTIEIDNTYKNKYKELCIRDWTDTHTHLGSIKRQWLFLGKSYLCK